MQNTEWRKWTDFIGLVLATGYVKGGTAESIMLVGDPGSGKSALLERFAEVPSVMVATDATSDGIKRHIIPDAIRRRARHLMLPEMYKLMQRRGATADNTIGILTLMMSGEMRKAYIGRDEPEEFPADFQMGVVAAMPSRVFADWNISINNTGLLSRMMPIAFTLSPEQRASIELAIARQDATLLRPVCYQWPDRPVEVQWNDRLAGLVMRLADDIRSSNEQRNRLIQMLVSLAQGATILEREHRTTPRHLDMVRSFLPLIQLVKAKPKSIPKKKP